MLCRSPCQLELSHARGRSRAQYEGDPMTQERPRSADFIARDRALGASNYHPLDVVLTRGRGAWVWDVDGNRYLDCLAGYSALNQGHCHPRILDAMKRQAE